MPESETGTSAECQSIVIAGAGSAAKIREATELCSLDVAGKRLMGRGKPWKRRSMAKSKKATIPCGLTSVFAHLHTLKVCVDKTVTCNRSYPGNASSYMVAYPKLPIMALSFVQIPPMSEGCR